MIRDLTPDLPSRHDPDVVAFHQALLAGGVTLVRQCTALHPEGQLIARVQRRESSAALLERSKAFIAERKPELLELLRSRVTHPCSGCGKFAFHAPTICHWCRRPRSGTAPGGQ